MGDSLYQVVEIAFESGVILEQLNETFIVLIPKVKSHETLCQFRPISLGTVFYKLITKVMANQMKVVLPKLISSAQMIFAPSKNITDNIVIAQEIVHMMRKRKGGKYIVLQLIYRRPMTN